MSQTKAFELRPTNRRGGRGVQRNYYQKRLGNNKDWNLEDRIKNEDYDNNKAPSRNHSKNWETNKKGQSKVCQQERNKNLVPPVDKSQPQRYLGIHQREEEFQTQINPVCLDIERLENESTGASTPLQEFIKQIKANKANRKIGGNSNSVDGNSQEYDTVQRSLSSSGSASSSTRQKYGLNTEGTDGKCKYATYSAPKHASNPIFISELKQRFHSMLSQSTLFLGETPQRILSSHSKVETTNQTNCDIKTRLDEGRESCFKEVQTCGNGFTNNNKKRNDIGESHTSRLINVDKIQSNEYGKKLQFWAPRDQNYNHSGYAQYTQINSESIPKPERESETFYYTNFGKQGYKISACLTQPHKPTLGSTFLLLMDEFESNFTKNNNMQFPQVGSSKDLPEISGLLQKGQQKFKQISNNNYENLNYSKESHYLQQQDNRQYNSMKTEVSFNDTSFRSTEQLQEIPLKTVNTRQSASHKTDVIHNGEVAKPQSTELLLHNNPLVGSNSSTNRSNISRSNDIRSQENLFYSQIKTYNVDSSTNITNKNSECVETSIKERVNPQVSLFNGSNCQQSSSLVSNTMLNPVAYFHQVKPEHDDSNSRSSQNVVNVPTQCNTRGTSTVAHIKPDIHSYQSCNNTELIPKNKSSDILCSTHISNLIFTSPALLSELKKESSITSEDKVVSQYDVTYDQLSSIKKDSQKKIKKPLKKTSNFLVNDEPLSKLEKRHAIFKSVGFPGDPNLKNKSVDCKSLVDDNSVFFQPSTERGYTSGKPFDAQSNISEPNLSSAGSYPQRMIDESKQHLPLTNSKEISMSSSSVKCVALCDGEVAGGQAYNIRCKVNGRTERVLPRTEYVGRIQYENDVKALEHQIKEQEKAAKKRKEWLARYEYVDQGHKLSEGYLDEAVGGHDPDIGVKKLKSMNVVRQRQQEQQAMDALAYQEVENKKKEEKFKRKEAKRKTESERYKHVSSGQRLGGNNTDPTRGPSLIKTEADVRQQQQEQLGRDALIFQEQETKRREEISGREEEKKTSKLDRNHLMNPGYKLGGSEHTDPTRGPLLIKTEAEVRQQQQEQLRRNALIFQEQERKVCEEILKREEAMKISELERYNITSPDYKLGGSEHAGQEAHRHAQAEHQAPDTQHQISRGRESTNGKQEPLPHTSASDSKDIATEGPSISEIGNIFTKLLATKKSTTKQDEEIRLSMLSQLQLVLDRNNKPDTPNTPIAVNKISSSAECKRNTENPAAQNVPAVLSNGTTASHKTSDHYFLGSTNIDSSSLFSPGCTGKLACSSVKTHSKGAVLVIGQSQEAVEQAVSRIIAVEDMYKHGNSSLYKLQGEQAPAYAHNGFERNNSNSLPCNTTNQYQKMATSAKTEEYDPQLDDMIRESATENSLTEIAKSTGAIPKKRSLLNPPRPESKDHSLGSSKQESPEDAQQEMRAARLKMQQMYDQSVRKAASVPQNT